MDRFLSQASLAIACGFAFVVIGPPGRAANIDHGKELFSANCTVCHNADKGGPNKLGPNLYGVVGRPAASLASFAYSSAMKSSGITWTPDRLSAYLAGPQKMVPGIRMTFAGFRNPSDAQDVVGYLATLK
ncbi:MAG TPA: cytochrome c family protein [Rhizomicrobium sp.]|jgi:cytochrome c